MDASVTAAIKFDDESATFECQGSTCTLILSVSGFAHHVLFGIPRDPYQSLLESLLKDPGL